VFSPVAGHIVRADLQGGGLSSDFGALLLRGIDRPLGLPARRAAALRDNRPPSYSDHPWRDLLAQRVSQRAAGYAEAHDAHSLRRAPLCTLGLERFPLAPDQDLARAPPFSRLDPSVGRTDLSRLPRALVDHCRASYPAPPAASGLDVDHPDDPTQGQQELAFSHHSSRSYGALPRLVCEGTSGALGMACLRLGKRPTGAEPALILARLLAQLRPQWPQTPLLVRGASPCAPPAGIDTLPRVPGTDCVCGLAAQAVLLRQAAAVREAARQRHRQRPAVALAPGESPPPRSRL
jgi:Transposase DDE domain group 1